MSRKDRPMFNMDKDEHRKFVRKYIDGLKGLIYLEVTRPRTGKTSNQLAFIFGCVYPRLAAFLSDVTGESYCSIRAHEFLKQKFLRLPVVNRETGEEFGYYTQSLADLDVEECSRYIEQLLAFAAENGVNVPPAAHYQEATA